MNPANWTAIHRTWKSGAKLVTVGVLIGVSWFITSSQFPDLSLFFLPLAIISGGLFGPGIRLIKDAKQHPNVMRCEHCGAIIDENRALIRGPEF